MRKACGINSVKTSVCVDRGVEFSTKTQLSAAHEVVSKRKIGEPSCKIDSKKKLRRSKEIEDDAMTFTVDSLTSQWDSELSASEESADSASRSKHDIQDTQLLSSKKSGITNVHTDCASLAITPLLTTKKTAADEILVSKRQGGLAARRSYGRSHADKYAKKTKSARNPGSMSNGKTVISVGSLRISPKFSISSRKKSSVDRSQVENKTHSAAKSSNRNQIDDLLIDSDESVIEPAKHDSSATKTARKRILETSSESDESPRKWKSNWESDGDEF